MKILDFQEIFNDIFLMITTVIGSYPKPSYLQVPDWFNAKGGTDTVNPTKDYGDAISKMGDQKEKIF